jgi:hypothetical protein
VIRGAILLAALTLGSVASVRAQDVDSNLWVPDGEVDAVAVSGNTLYLGGQFSRLGPASGCGALIDPGTGALLPNFPQVNGYVLAVTPDGAGGWFIGGFFTSVGGFPRTSLAHINSDLSVDPWNPVLLGNGTGPQVLAIAVNGTSVDIGGLFTQVNGQPRSNLAAIDASSGAVGAWNPSPNASVNALVANAGQVYAGGDFTIISGQPRQRLAGFDPGGALSSWDPQADLIVYALTISASGTTVYAGGDFSYAGGLRNRIAEIDLGTGVATAWNPSASGTVMSIVVNGGDVFVGGYFGSIGGAGRTGLAELDASTGNATSWNPSPDPAAVRAISIANGFVYVGGQFTSISGTTRNFLGAVDLTFGTVSSWDPDPNAQVFALSAGSAVYAGGYFTSFGGVPRNNLAAVKLTNGQPTAWNPNVNAQVSALAVSGSTVYAGGSFTQVGANTRTNIAAIDAGTGVATSFKPNADGPVRAITVTGTGANTMIVVGGSFANIGGLARNNLALVKIGGTAYAPFNPNVNGPVNTIVVSGSTVYVGGSFSTVGGATRNNVAAIDATNGNALGWIPSADAQVKAMAMGSTSLYVGGDFTNLTGQTRNHLAALDPGSGNVLSWNPNVDGSVNALVTSPTLVYAGGVFNHVDVAGRKNLAAIDAATGGAIGWSADALFGLFSLARTSTRLYAGGYFYGVGLTAQSRIAGIHSAPELLSVMPSTGGNSGSITVDLQGTGFTPGTTVSLTRAAATNINGTQVVVDPGGELLSATLDLTAQTPGAWNVMLTTPDLMSTVLPSSFTITSLAAPQLEVSIVGPDSIRASYPTAFDLVVENPGNVDAVSVPLWVTGIPSQVTVTPDFTLAPPPQDGGEPDWSQVPAAFLGASGQYLPVVLPRVPPGTSRRRFILNSPANISLMQMGAAVAPSWSAPGSLLSCLQGGGGLQNPSCAATQLAAIDAYLAANPGIDGMSGTGIWAKNAWECEGSMNLGDAEARSQLVLDLLDNAIENGTYPSTGGCGDAMLAQWRQVLSIHVVFAIDPNDKLGPAGTVSSQQPIPYSIRFENQASSSVAARQVTLVDPLPSTLDLNTLSLDAIDLFGSTHLIPPPGSKQYAVDVDLGHDNLIVRISVTLDSPTRQLSWVFTTLDKSTLQPPSNPLLGFLPPDQTPPQGEGSVLFTIKPSSSVPNGSTIQNSAVINFDGSSQATPVVANQIDTNAPASNVLSLNTPISTSSFPVSWTATGSPSDLKDFTIYVSEDGNPYSAWKVNTTTTSDTYVPRPGGHNYYFYSVARDQSGNIEAPPTSPDAQTLSTTAVGPAGPALKLALAGVRPNPARGGILRVAFTLPSRERATLELLDIAGRRVASREVGALGPGPQELTLEKPRLEAGLYFLRLTQGREVVNARAVVMR